MLAHASHLMQSFWVKHHIIQVTQPSYSPDLVACDFCLFPKLKSPLKGKWFQTVNEIQENAVGQLLVIGRIVWGAEALLSYVQCLLYLVSSSISVSIFHSTWLDTFWTDLELLTEYEILTECFRLLKILLVKGWKNELHNTKCYFTSVFGDILNI